MSLPLPNQAPSPDPTAYGWTPERQALFLQALSLHGNARAACRAVGMSAEAAYKLRRRDPLFARGWAAAVVLGRDNSIETLGERAIEGVEEHIYYRGELVGTRRRYDSRLLLAHLARLDLLAESRAARADAGRFDELLACLVEGSQALPPAREEYVQEVEGAAQGEVRARQIENYPDLFDETLGNLTGDEAERVKELDADCIEVGEHAAQEAGEAWDDHLAAAFAAVDSLCEERCEERCEEACDRPRDAAMPSAIQGASALPASLAVLVANRPADAVPPTPKGEGLAFPCTLSTVSTSTLAKTLAGPLPFRPPTPRSPLRSR